MPSNNFTTGRDVALVLQTATGRLDISAGITNFTADPVTTEIMSDNLNGVNQSAVIPKGWKGSFKIDRMNPLVDNYWAAFEAGYYAGNNQLAGTVYQTIKEADNSITKWRFTGVTIKLEKGGDFSSDKKVEQSLSFTASKRIKVS